MTPPADTGQLVGGAVVSTSPGFRSRGFKRFSTGIQDTFDRGSLRSEGPRGPTEFRLV